MDGPLSPLHHEVGLRVSSHFVSHSDQPNLASRAEYFGWSVHKQGRIERGTWEFTLSDLMILSRTMNCPISHLVGERNGIS